MIGRSREHLGDREGLGALPPGELIDKLLDQELPKNLRAEALARIASERRLREEYASHRDTISRFDDPLASPDVRACVLEEVNRVRPFVPPRWRRIITTGRVLAAAACLAVGAGVAFVHQHHPELTIEGAPVMHVASLQQAAATEIAQPILQSGERVQRFLRADPQDFLLTGRTPDARGDASAHRATADSRRMRPDRQNFTLRVAHTPTPSGDASATAPDHSTARVRGVSLDALPIDPYFSHALPAGSIAHQPMATVTVMIRRTGSPETQDAFRPATIVLPASSLTGDGLTMHGLIQQPLFTGSGVARPSQPAPRRTPIFESIRSDEVTNLLDIRGTD